MVSAVAIALAALVVVGALVAWIRSKDDEDGRGASGPQPIATFDTPDVHSLLIDPADPDHVLFGSHAGVMESRDGGFTWEDGPLRGKDAMSLAMSPENPTTIYVTGHNVVEVSRDGGATWQPLQHDLPSTDIHAFAQDPLTSDVLYAVVAGQGVLISENGGANWLPLDNQPPGGTPVSLAAVGGRVFAVTADGIVASGDRGSTWQPLPAQPVGSPITLALSPADPQTIYVGTSDGLARSNDGGASWTVLGPTDIPALALAVAPTDPLRVEFVAEGGGVYRTDDGGATWRAPT